MVNDVSKEKIIKKFQKLQERNFMTVATVAHDLRAPLNFLKSNNDLIKMNLQESDRKKLEHYFKRFDNQFYY
jgi:signal transduction histidine kinase